MTTARQSHAGLRALSCHSTHLDPYRAGVEIGEGLATIAPELVFLFPTIHYEGSPELLEAIYEVLGNDELVLIGNTGEGFYERDKVAGAGVAALGLSAGGRIAWRLEHEPGVGHDPFGATQRCLNRLNARCRPEGPALYFLATDFRTDTSAVAAALGQYARAPVVGGSAADDYHMQRCFVFAGREVLTDSLAVLALDGELDFDLRVANDMWPVGRAGQVTDSEGTALHTIDDLPAAEFLERELGKPMGLVDEGVVTFRLTSDPSRPAHRIRSIWSDAEQSRAGSLRLFGGVAAGEQVQVCMAPPERILEDVRRVADSLAELSFTPSAAILVSCAGRKRVLGEDLALETQAILAACPSLQALAGYPSFGEFAPLRVDGGLSAPLFHNMTLVLLLLGSPR